MGTRTLPMNHPTSDMIRMMTLSDMLNLGWQHFTDIQVISCKIVHATNKYGLMDHGDVKMPTTNAVAAVSSI